jgi:hypothetical protein
MLNTLKSRKVRERFVFAKFIKFINYITEMPYIPYFKYKVPYIMSDKRLSRYREYILYPARKYDGILVASLLKRVLNR